MWNRLLIPVAIASSLSVCACQTGHQAPGAGLNAYVTAYFREQHADAPDRTARFSMALADLNGDGLEEALVHVMAIHCGTAGCGLQVFTPHEGSWRLHSDISSGHAPFRLLTTHSDGWGDIGVFIAGGGVVPHEARLSFNGNSYPNNPYEAPPAADDGQAPGRVVIRPDDPASPIFE